MPPYRVTVGSVLSRALKLKSGCLKSMSKCPSPWCLRTYLSAKRENTNPVVANSMRSRNPISALFKLPPLPFNDQAHAKNDKSTDQEQDHPVRRTCGRPRNIATSGLLARAADHQFQGAQCHQQHASLKEAIYNPMDDTLNLLRVGHPHTEPIATCGYPSAGRHPGSIYGYAHPRLGVPPFTT